MNRLKYWKTVCDEIEKYLESKNIALFDIFLVGSQVKSHKVNSDFDNIVIIKNELSEFTLNVIKTKLDRKIRKRNSNFHFKIFGLIDLKNSSLYDGYRIYDFKSTNISLKGTNILENQSVKLDIVNFSNSILIQFVHKFNKLRLGLITLEMLNDNTNRWIRFNNKINELNDIDVMSLEEATNANELLYNFQKEIIGKNDIIKLSEFLNQYFKLIPHEFINQSHVYQKGILYEENFFGQL